MVSELSRGGGPPAALLMLTFGLLSAAASAVMLHTLLAPTPLPAALIPGPKQPAIRGYRLEPLTGADAAAGRRLSHSGVRRFAVKADAGGPVLQLTLVNMHSRSHHSFQLAGLTSGRDAPSGLALQNRRLQTGALATALGTLAVDSGQPARIALQGCLIGGRRGEQLKAGVTQQQLADQYDRRVERQAGPVGPVRAALDELAPWRNQPWECLLVSISAPASEPGAEAALQRFWKTAAPSLARMVP